MAELPNTALPSFLSGLLIGSEFAGARALYGEPGNLHLIASGSMAENYAQAFAAVELSVTSWDAEQAALAGLWQAAEYLEKS